MAKEMRKTVLGWELIPGENGDWTKEVKKNESKRNIG